LVIALAAALVVILVVAGYLGFQAFRNRDDGTTTAQDYVAALNAQAASLADANSTASDGGASDAGSAASDGKTASLPSADATAYEQVIGPLVEDGAVPTVTLQDVSGEDDSRTLSLAWSWEVPGLDDAWTYTTEATMSRDAGEWSVDFAPTLVEGSLQEGQNLDLHVTEPELGSITDRNGTQIFGETDVLVLGIDADNYEKSVENYGDEAFVPALTIRASAVDDYDLAAAKEIPGYLAQETTRPLAVEKTYAPGVLGSVSEASAEDVENSGGEIHAGDYVASGGVAAARSDQLLGTPGVAVQAVDPEAEDDEEGHRDLVGQESVNGTEVQTTLDDDLQRMATDSISDTDAASAVVIMQPSTGDVLASALGPTGQEYPVGLVGQYAPGSTFKTVTALSLLREGDTPDSELQCPETANVGGQVFKNADSMDSSLFGTMTLADAIAHSCNTAMLLQYDRVEQSELVSAAETLGFGQDAPEGLESAFMGSVNPDDEGTQHAADMMGQGNDLASPLTMTTALSSVVAGETVHPRILADDDSAAPEVSEPLTDDEAETLQSLLRGVVTDGSLDDFADLPGDPVIGKTGTAEWVNEDGELKLHSWVIVAQGDLAVAVFVEDGSYGSVTAGPIALDVLEGAANQE
jgi:hypothetical protein